MKIKVYKVEPIITKMTCDCGGDIISDNDISNLFTMLIDSTKGEVKYKYKCAKCGKTFESTQNFKPGEVVHKYGELIKSLEISEEEFNKS